MPKKPEEKPRRGRPPGSTSPTSLHAARTRKERALAELREMEVQQKKGELLGAEEVTREWQDVLRQVRAGVLAVVSRVRAQIPSLDPHAVKVLDKEIRSALTALGTGTARNADAR